MHGVCTRIDGIDATVILTPILGGARNLLGVPVIGLG